MSRKNKNIPKEWKVPHWDRFYKKFKRSGKLYSMTEPDWNIANKYLKQKRVAIDVGAHIGTTAVRYSENFATVLAFEPVYIDYLKENTKHLDNIEYFEIALSNNTGVVDMIRMKHNSGITLINTEHALNAITKRTYHLEPQQYRADSLDNILPYTTPVDFIKIDTEGYVYQILVGAMQTLKRNQPLLQIEFNNLCPNKEKCEHLLQYLGYEHVDSFDVDQFYMVVK